MTTNFTYAHHTPTNTAPACLTAGGGLPYTNIQQTLLYNIMNTTQFITLQKHYAQKKKLLTSQNENNTLY